MDASMLAALYVCPVCYRRFPRMPTRAADDAVALGAFVRSVVRHLDGHALSEWLPALLAAQQASTTVCPECLGHGALPAPGPDPATCQYCSGRGRVPVFGDDPEQTRPMAFPG